MMQNVQRIAAVLHLHEHRGRPLRKTLRADGAISLTDMMSATGPFRCLRRRNRHRTRARARATRLAHLSSIAEHAIDLAISANMSVVFARAA